MSDRQFFDKIAQTWDQDEILSTPQKVKKILEYMDIKKGQKVLDLGTGTGILLPYVAEKIGEEGKITAVDFSICMLERAKAKFSGITPSPEFLNLDIENETVPGEFDRIILYCVYPHLHSPIDTLKWLEKVNLSPNGIISIAFPCSQDFINNIHKEKKAESDILPSATQLAEFLIDKGLDAHVAAASDNEYVVNIYKMNV